MIILHERLSPGHSLTQFVRHCADHFLNSEHKEIRMEAARTCSRLLTPSIHLISGHVVSQTAVQVVADVLSKLLVVGITDPGNKCTEKENGITMQIYFVLLLLWCEASELLTATVIHYGSV